MADQQNQEGMPTREGNRRGQHDRENQQADSRHHHQNEDDEEEGAERARQEAEEEVAMAEIAPGGVLVHGWVGEWVHVRT